MWSFELPVKNFVILLTKAYQLKLRKYMVHYIWSSSVALSAKMVLFLLVLFSSLSSILCLKQLRGFVVLSCNYMGLEASATYCAEQVYPLVIEIHTMLFCFTE
jgi:hypothetical protein